MRIEMRLKQGIEELRSADFGQGMDSAIGLMRFPSHSPSERIWIRRASVIAVGLIVITTGFLLLVPSQAIGLDEIQLALKSVPASHSRFISTKGNVTFESWQEGTKRRYKIGNHIDRGFNNNVVWYTHPGEKYAVISAAKPDGFGRDGTGIENVLSAHQGETVGKPKLSRRDVVFGNQKVVEITITSRRLKSPSELRKSVAYCRLSDHLPLRVNQIVEKNGKEVQSGHYLFEYPTDIPDAFFDPAIPDGFVVLNEKAAVDQILGRMNNPSYQRKVNGVSVALLGVFSDRNHDPWEKECGTFVVFAGGATPHIDFTAGLLNEDGRGYSASLHYPTDDPARTRNFGRDEAVAKQTPPSAKRRVHGQTSDFPQHIRPLFYIQNRPIYCLRFGVEPNRWKGPLKVTVMIPASVSVPPRVLRNGELGSFIESDGRQVGLAKFTDTVIPIETFGALVKHFDPRVFSTQYLPIKGINVPPSKGYKVIKRQSQ